AGPRARQGHGYPLRAAAGRPARDCPPDRRCAAAGLERIRRQGSTRTSAGMNPGLAKAGLTLLAALLLAACATTAAPPPEDRHPRDPWEPYNRNMFAVNDALDRAVLRPVAVGYDKVAPKPVKHGVRNFFTNIRSPVNQIN